MAQRKSTAPSKSAKRSSRGATRSQEKNGMPSGLLFGAGFFCGIVATVLATSALDRNNTGARPDAAPVAASAKPVKPAAQPEPAKTTTRFDFFTVLPEQEVIVPDESPTISANNTAASRDNAQTPPTDTASDDTYILQAGSFRSYNDADRRRAQIILLGLDANVESVDANGDRWHRVYVGPFQSNRSLAGARNKLINEGIDTLVMRKKG